MNVLKYVDTVKRNYGDGKHPIKTDAEYERLNPTERYNDRTQAHDRQKKVVKKIKPSKETTYKPDTYLNYIFPNTFKF